MAARASKEFNPQLKIEHMCERVGGDTENIFDDNFFERLDGVANALDNVEARRLINYTHIMSTIDEFIY